jgi:hypothetical protein
MSVQRSNIGLMSGSYYMENQLINSMTKQAQSLNNVAAGRLSFLYKDGNGFPINLSFPMSSLIHVVGLKPGEAFANYVVRWTGRGSWSHVSFGRTMAPPKRTKNGTSWIGTSMNTVTTNGRLKFTIAAGGTYQSGFTIAGDGSLTDFLVCREDEEDLYDSGMRFRPAWRDLITEYNPAWMRFMDPCGGNGSVLAYFADRANKNQLVYDDGHIPANRFVSSSGVYGDLLNYSNSGSEQYSGKTASGSSGAYKHGENFFVLPSVSNTTTNCTFEVDGRGAKQIMNKGIPPIIAGARSSNRTTSFLKDSAYGLVYDKYFDKFLFGGVYVGEPWEHMIDACNVTNHAGWFTLSPYMSDACVASIAQLFVDTYKPDKVLFELGNEIWNTANADFWLTGMIMQWSQVEDGGRPEDPIRGTPIFNSPPLGKYDHGTWYGWRLKKVADIMRPIFAAAGQSPKLKIVLMSQGAMGDSIASLTSEIENKRFQNLKYAATSDVGNRAIDQTDYIGYAWYFRPNTILGDANDVGWNLITLQPQLKAAVDSYSADPTRTDGFDMLAAVWMADVNITSRLANPGRLANFDALAKKYDKQVVLYEYNQQVAAPSKQFTSGSPAWGNDGSYGGVGGKIDLFLNAFWNSSQYQSVYSEMLKAFYTLERSLSSAQFSICTGPPWLTFPRYRPVNFPNNGGDTTLAPYANWRAHAEINNATKRTIKLKN